MVNAVLLFSAINSLFYSLEGAMHVPVFVPMANRPMNEISSHLRKMYWAIEMVVESATLLPQVAEFDNILSRRKLVVHMPSTIS